MGHLITKLEPESKTQSSYFAMLLFFYYFVLHTYLLWEIQECGGILLCVTEFTIYLGMTKY